MTENLIYDVDVLVDTVNAFIGGIEDMFSIVFPMLGIIFILLFVFRIGRSF